MVSKLVSVFLIILFLISPILAIITEEGMVYKQVEDVYIFDEDGNYNRISTVWITHNGDSTLFNLSIVDLFSGQEDCSVQYKFFKEDSLGKLSFEEIACKEFTIVTDILPKTYVGYIRTYNGYQNISDTILRLELVFENNTKDAEVSNETYINTKMSYFHRILKVKKETGILRIRELNMKAMSPQPDIIYDEQDYTVFVWKQFPTDMQDIKINNIRFSYDYKIPTWWKWSLGGIIIGFMGVVVGIILHFSKRKDKDYGKMIKGLESITDIFNNYLLAKNFGPKTSEVIRKYFKK